MNFIGLFWQQPISNGREWIFTQNPEAFRIVRSCIRRRGFQAGALTKEIVPMHKGTIRAHNGESGTVFEITLPVGR